MLRSLAPNVCNRLTKLMSHFHYAAEWSSKRNVPWERRLRQSGEMPISKDRRKRGHGSHDRRLGPRSGTKVAHRHRVGTAISDRVSELTYVNGRPVALLDWINLGGVRTPLYVCELDPAKLKAVDETGVFYYEGVTTDPRFLDSFGA